MTKVYALFEADGMSYRQFIRYASPRAKERDHNPSTRPVQKPARAEARDRPPSPRQLPRCRRCKRLPFRSLRHRQQEAHLRQRPAKAMPRSERCTSSSTAKAGSANRSSPSFSPYTTAISVRQSSASTPMPPPRPFRALWRSMSPASRSWKARILNTRKCDGVLEPILTEDAHCVVDTGTSGSRRVPLSDRKRCPRPDPRVRQEGRGPRHHRRRLATLA